MFEIVFDSVCYSQDEAHPSEANVQISSCCCLMKRSVVGPGLLVLLHRAEVQLQTGNIYWGSLQHLNHHSSVLMLASCSLWLWFWSELIHLSQTCSVNESRHCFTKKKMQQSLLVSAEFTQFSESFRCSCCNDSCMTWTGSIVPPECKKKKKPKELPEVLFAAKQPVQLLQEAEFAFK